jgi:hypothetical protein
LFWQSLRSTSASASFMMPPSQARPICPDSFPD